MNKPPVKSSSSPEDSLDVEMLEPLFRPDQREKGIQMVTTMVAKHHSGPLPDPETFLQYEQILPGTAERVLAMAEKEQDHRHVTEKSVVRHEYTVRYVSQLGALAALLALCGVVVYCARIGQSVPATLLGAMGGIVVLFLRHTQVKMDKAHSQSEKPPAKRNSNRKKRGS